jgi:hypothetical protein
MFLWDGTETMEDPTLNAFIFAGLRVRFDVGGVSERADPALASF